MKTIKNYLLAYLFLAMGSSAFGQTPPVDLANMSLGDLLNAKIIRSYADHAAFKTGGQGAPLGYLDSSRFHFSTSYVKVRFDGYMDGTDDVSINDVLWPWMEPALTKTSPSYQQSLLRRPFSLKARMTSRSNGA